MKLNLLVVFWAAILFINPEPGYAQAQEPRTRDVVVRELKDELLVYDNEYQTYVPFVEDIHQNFNTLNFWISRNEFYGYVLRFKTSPDLCVLINQKLVRSYSGTGTAELDLTNMNLAEKGRELFVTFYHPRSAYKAVGDPLIVYKSEAEVAAVAPVSNKPSNTNIYKPEKRSVSPLRSVFLLYFLGLFALYIAAKNIAPSLFAAYFDLGRLFSENIAEYSSAIKKSWNSVSILIIAINSVCIAFILAMLRPDFHFVSIYKIEYSEELWGFLGAYLRLIGLCLIYYLLKFSLLYLSGQLFNVKAFINAHFYEFVRFSTIISILLLSLLFLQYNTAYISEEAFASIAKYLVLGLLIVLTLKISLVLNRSVAFRNLYLFSYLCATEIIPVFIVVKYFQIG